LTLRIFNLNIRAGMHEPEQCQLPTRIYKDVVCAGERHRDNVLQMIGATLKAWVIQVKREKAIYHVLNKCSVDVTRKVLVAEAWCPVSAKPRLHEALREAAHTTSASVSSLARAHPPESMNPFLPERGCDSIHFCFVRGCTHMP
jgi:hypothetical protein